MKRFVILAVFVLASSWWGAVMLRRLAVARAAMAAPISLPGGDATRAIRAAAGKRGVAVLRIDAAGRDRVRTAVTLAGREPAMRAALADLEAGRPAVRFLQWRLQPEAGSADRLRFDGVASMAPR